MDTAQRVNAATLWFTAVTATVSASTPTLFMAFLFAYGFQDDIGWGNHTFFLTACLVITAAESLLVGMLVLAADRGRRRARAASFGALVTWGLNLVALSAGVLISLTHERENSVTADQADWPFVVLLVAALVLGAVSLVSAARTVPVRRG